MQKKMKEKLKTAFEVKKRIIDVSYFIVSESDFVSRNLIWIEIKFGLTSTATSSRHTNASRVRLEQTYVIRF